ncbi:HlyD family efflux transporter periplasmic adaptor subunit [Streptomyces sp. NPDC052721]|uniref:HlyD family efflux transporter periplasmic adaptor subunit n=1 Tax=Streptomyces sp. NPDC052721 TaxID=3154955 RepID=UPI0034206449
MSDDIAASPRETKHAPEEGTVRSDLTRRRRWLAAVAVGAVLLALSGVAAARLVKSPAQALADSRPPAPDVLTAPVEWRTLKDTVVLRGTVTADQSVSVTPVASGQKGAVAPVVTKIPVKAGSTVKAGQLLLEVSGRPVIALKGVVPAYRDLRPGAVGQDVAQLQRALRSLGYGTGADASDGFGAGTKAALRSLYSSLGYEPVPATDDDGKGVKAAEEAVKQARRNLEDARYAARTSDSGGSGASGGSEADGAKVSDAGTTGTGDVGSDASGGSPAGTTGDGRRAVERAAEDLADAQRELDDVRAASGPMLPSSEVVFLSDFPARVDRITAGVGARTDESVMTVSAGRLEVHGYLQDHQKGLVRAGQRVEIRSESSGFAVPAKVRSVAGSPDQGGADTSGGTGSSGAGGQGGAGTGTPRGYLMVVEPDKALDGQLVGQDVRLTIEAASTDGKALVVPLTAVSSGADGKTTVTVVDGDGRRRRVEVRTGTDGDGFVEVAPVGGGRLEEGDRVVTGIRGDGGAAGGTDAYGTSGGPEGGGA